MLENSFYVYQEKASIFNSYFASQFRPFDIDSSLPAFTPLSSNSLHDNAFTHPNIVKIILDSKKANGFDGISASILKICPEEVAKPLHLIFRKPLDTGLFPSSWKYANVQPVHKKKSRQDKSMYPPISLLCLCSKIYEKLLFDGVYNFLISNTILSPNQSVFSSWRFYYKPTARHYI